MAANRRCPNPHCEFFNRILPNNVNVCPLCGTALGSLNAVPPSAPPTPASAAQPPPVVEQPAYLPPTPPSRSPTYPEPAPYVPPSQPVSPAYSPPPHPTRPTFRLFHSSGREFRLLGEDGYIGRRGQTGRTVLEIDLTGIPNEGIVSRAHARVYWDWSQNAYILIDNTSRNGTYLNGNPLPPGVPYRLNHNDSIQLGQNNLVCFTVSLM